MVRCPKCDRWAWKPLKVNRRGKTPGQVYVYLRYRHPIDGRTGRNADHYVRADAPKKLEETAKPVVAKGEVEDPAASLEGYTPDLRDKLQGSIKRKTPKSPLDL